MIDNLVNVKTILIDYNINESTFRAWICRNFRDIKGLVYFTASRQLLVDKAAFERWHADYRQPRRLSESQCQA